MTCARRRAGQFTLDEGSIVSHNPRLTNDESTWINPVPANEDDGYFLTHEYLPRLCIAYIYENEGGETEVNLYAGDPRAPSLYVDNVTPDGCLVENKSTVVSAGRQLVQLRNYLRYLDAHGGSLDYCFFRNPVSGMGGPTTKFALALAVAAKEYDVGVRVYDNDWWEELQ